MATADLRTRADAEAMLAASQDGPVLVLKHSLTCPISARGAAEFEAAGATAGPDGPPRYRVVVQTARDVSRWLAEALDVRHESPQALVVAGGQAVAVFNHFDVRADALRAAVRAHAADAAPGA